MDKRYEKPCIFDLREKDWNKEKVQRDIENIFKTVEIMPNWTYHSSKWSEPTITKNSKEELKQSIYSFLKIDISDPSGKHHEYKLQVPDLIHDQFFFIGGYYKVPIFQLYDMPIIFRKKNPNLHGTTTDPTVIRFRNNAITISLMIEVDKKDETTHIHLKLFNRTIPFHILLAAFHTKEEIEDIKNKFAQPTSIFSNLGDHYFNVVLENAKNEWDLQLTQEEKYNRVGEYFMSKPSERSKKGEDVLFSLKAAYEVDHFSRQFYDTDSILKEILIQLIGESVLCKRGDGDTDLRNKRLRFSEYVLSPLIRKVYEFMITVHRNHKDKFQIPQNIILDSCNASSGDHKNDVANIIHFNFPINPIGEIASLMQTTLVGPGGFKKENIPPHLRNLQETQMHILCPADTPDREGCGVINNLVPTAAIKDDLTFDFENTSKEVVTSFPISLVPFLENDDATRLQMASSQLKQTIWIKDAEKPIVKSGLEDAYLDKTTFFRRAKRDGIVTYLDNEYMIVVYDDDPIDAELFEINYRSMYLNTVDKIVTRLSVGDRFEKGDVLCCSKFIREGELALGRNLLTAVMVWKGYNYEDGIVISESVVNKMRSTHAVDITYHIEPGQILLTLEDDTYKPFPDIGQKLKKGEVFAKIKNIDFENGIENINEEPVFQVAPEDCEVIGITLYPNSWNKEVEQFHRKIGSMMDVQINRYNSIFNSLVPYLPENEIAKFTKRSNISNLNCDKNNIGKYVTKNQKIGGILVKIHAIYEEAICVGDKIANRHGNKGVISKIVPDEEMPVLEDGRKAEIIINPLGIISRMNVGQLFELHMGEAVYQLKNKLKKLGNSKEDFQIAKEELTTFLSLVDNTPTKWPTDKIIKEFTRVYKKTGKVATAAEYIYVIQPPFQSTPPEKLFEAMVHVGANFESKIFDPITKRNIENPVAVGYMYFDKLVHRATEKLSARSIGPYNRKTSQPMSGKTNLGGHRLGEMEVWALLAHDSKTFLKDLLTVHSDSVGKKNRILAEILQNSALANNEESDDKPQSLRVMEAYLTSCGMVWFDDDDVVQDVPLDLEAADEVDELEDMQIV